MIVMGQLWWLKASLVLAIVPHCVSLDVHISMNMRIGTVVADVSLGPEWTYAVDRLKSRGIFTPLKLTASGMLRFAGWKSCKSLHQNPTTIYINAVSKADLSYVVIPVNVYFHGNLCKTPVSKKSKEIIISTHYDIDPGSCVDEKFKLFSVNKFIPLSLRHSKFHYSTVNTNFSIDSASGDIHTATSLCMLTGLWKIDIELYLRSSSVGTLQLTVLIWPSEKYVHSTSIRRKAYQVVRRLRRGTNNHSPSFSTSQYQGSIDEGRPAGTSVVRIMARDNDYTDANGHLVYSMTALRDGRSQNMFEINPSSGWITTKVVLDRELMPEHHFQILAEDDGSPRRTGTTSLVITVTDINDNKPEFEETRYFHSVPENIQVGSTVLTVRASDGDEGDNRVISYRIANPQPPNDVFLIGSTGSIKLVKPLDREKHDSYTMTVLAVDNAANPSQRKTGTTTVTISVSDVNDNVPQFSQTSYTFFVSEGLDPSEGSSQSLIGRIRATDKDAGQNGIVHYSIYSGNGDKNFRITQTTGDLLLSRQLDREFQDTYSLTVKATDLGSPFGNFNLSVVLIKVTDINDETPAFGQDIFSGIVSENCANNTEVVEVQAIDGDTGENGRITYTIIGAPADSPFFVDRNGMLKTKATVDREKHAQYSFQVRASDNGVPKKSATARVQITVLDENDEAPVFSQRLYEAQVLETAPMGKSVLSVSARDKDSGLNGRVQYSITSGNVGNAFKIRTSSGAGQIIVNRPLNYKITNRYSLFIKAFDRSNNQDTVNAIIKVVDENNHAPRFQSFQYHTAVNENLRTGTSIFRVSAEDADDGDNGRVTYKMFNSPHFRIDQDTGEISVVGNLDRESQQSYAIQLIAEDNGTPKKSGQSTLEILVNDVNDNPPKFEKDQYRAHVPESAFIDTSVIKIHATDADQSGLLNSQLYYTFQNGDNGGGHFRIDPTDGTIRVSARLDRETIASYNLKAFAIDRGTPELSSSVIIRVEVDDVNDNSPDWNLGGESGLTLIIKENSPIGSVVGQISASDADEGDNARVQYIIFRGADKDKFSLSNVNGVVEVITQTELDYESDQKEYHFIVRASSGDLVSDVKVTVNVVDVNDNSPVLNDFKIVFNNYKDKFVQGYIGRVPATDEDVNDRLQYEFTSGNSAGLLLLEPDTGKIKMDPRLNTDVTLNGTFEVKVSDGKNEKTAKCELYVRLVTKEMLKNSITVRLKEMTAKLFLSGLYNFFTTAIAAAIPSQEQDIYIFNIRDDTDVAENILNVSFSVRKGSDQNSQDIFYDSQFLMERVYLNRITINKIATMHVLPFDDNLCITEMCLNFKECRTALEFKEALPFINSSHMLFRSIYPDDQYRCVCPQGFTGLKKEELCDTEVNLCYSNPCQNNGTCSSREGGYTCICPNGFGGKHCQYDMSAGGQRYSTCPSDICKPPSQCVTLIKGGLRCEGCPKGAHYNAFCQLRTRNFTAGGFLMYPSLKRRHRFKFEVKFATRHRNGLLFYNGRYNNENDFVALELVDGDIRFSYNLGSANTTYVTLPVKHGVNDGQWQHVTVHYYNRTATIALGEDCDIEIALRYGRQSTSYPCAVQGYTKLPDKCRQSFVSCPRFLDLTGPLHLGGLPDVSRVDKRINSYDFDGCLTDIYIDDEFLDLNAYAYKTPTGTMEGCSQKNKHCTATKCTRQGTCMEGWGQYFCLCRPGHGGKDCSSNIDNPVRLTGNGYIVYRSVRSVQLPWFNGIAFRTVQADGHLMRISVGSDRVDIKIVDGLINYVYKRQTLVLDVTRVNDGRWHYFESRWLSSSELQMILDYGQIKKSYSISGSIAGASVSTVQVGGYLTNTQVTNGFKGCLKDVRVARSLTGGSKINDYTCTTTDPCDANRCPINSDCMPAWGTDKGYTCKCHQGYHGNNCASICRNFNPCKAGSTCVSSPSTSHGYKCQCPSNTFGQYCERKRQACAASWWGYPICGPCLCDGSKGFNSTCHKDNGLCSCKSDHYKPTGSTRCYPCNCYLIGSYNNTCNQETGQCYCRSGVIGKTCASCASEFAEVTLKGCKVQYQACPARFENNIEWLRTPFRTLRIAKCPAGSFGDVSRYCNKTVGWLPPDLKNCTSNAFLNLKAKREQIELGLAVNTFEAKNIIKALNNATASTPNLYINDVEIASYLLLKVLHYESNQTGLNLTHIQDRQFMQNLLNSASRLLDPRNKKHWETLLSRKDTQTVELLQQMELYLGNLVHNMATVLSTAIMNPLNLITENIVLGLDTLQFKNGSVSIPKYNNYVLSERMFDKDTHVSLPQSIFSSTSNNADEKAVAGYVLYKSLGDVLPRSYDEDGLRVHPKLSVNVPVFTLKLQYGSKPVSGPVSSSLALNFSQLQTKNRTSPQCVYWQHDNSSKSKGYWTNKYCQLTGRSNGTAGQKYVVCECSHLSSFAALMDISNVEYRASQAMVLEVITYAGLSISLVCLLATFIIFCLLHRLRSNAINIHINLVLCIFIAELFFLVGINRTKPELLCKVIAIVLHFFYMCTFSWLFVEGLHIYRMLTEIRNINKGGMKVYYVIGYVVPGIVVGLAVGLSTDGYGNKRFCWLSTSDLLIWSFAGPICLVVAINIIIFVMSIRASCKTKTMDADDGTMTSGLKAGIILLPLLATAWVFGLLSVNDDELAFHYLFAIITCLQGIFILLAHLLFSKQVRSELKRCWHVLLGKKVYDDTIGLSRTTRSALAYTNNSSLEGGLNKMNVGISASSTTSRTTSKSSGVYRPSYYQSTSTSTNGPSVTDVPPNTGIPPYGYDSSMFHNKGQDEHDGGEGGGRRRHNDSDSDSELSVNGDLDLASSHSSDDDDDEDDDQFDTAPRWDHFPGPQNRALDRVKATTPSSPQTPKGLVHSTPYPSFPPPTYQQSSSDRKVHWQGEDTVIPTSPQHVQLATLDKSPVPGSREDITGSQELPISPPERVDSLPSHDSSSQNSPSIRRPPAVMPRPAAGPTMSSPRQQRVVKVLTHNGSVSSDSDDHETSV